jgi:hypothetical protein
MDSRRHSSNLWRHRGPLPQCSLVCSAHETSVRSSKATAIFRLGPHTAAQALIRVVAKLDHDRGDEHAAAKDIPETRPLAHLRLRPALGRASLQVAQGGQSLATLSSSERPTRGLGAPGGRPAREIAGKSGAPPAPAGIVERVGFTGVSSGPAWTRTRDLPIMRASLGLPAFAHCRAEWL